MLEKYRDIAKQIEALLKLRKDSKLDAPDYELDHKPTFKDRIHWARSKKKKAAELLNDVKECKSTISVTFDNEMLYFSLKRLI